MTKPGEDPVTTPELCRAQKYAEAVAVAERDHHCKHGHLDCAVYDGGPCMRELLSTCRCTDCREERETYR